MNKEELIKQLERTIVERTPRYDDVDGWFRYDEQLMKSNYLLAKISFQDRRTVRARTYIRGAEHQLNCFNDSLQQKVKPIIESGEDRKKFHRWTKKIFDLGDRIQ